MRKILFILLFILIYLVLNGTNRYNGTYFNNRIYLKIDNDSFRISYNTNNYSKTIGKGYIKQNHEEIILIDIKDNRKMKLKKIDPYQLKIIDMDDFLNQRNINNCFKKNLQQKQLTHIGEIIKENKFYIRFKNNKIYLWENGLIRWIIDSPKRIQYNAKKKQWEAIENSNKGLIFNDFTTSITIEDDY